MLKTDIDRLAEEFVRKVLVAMQSASLEDILDATARGAPRSPHAEPALPSRRRGRRRRLARRSPVELEATLERVIALVKKAPLRSEEIRKQLGLDVRELPKVFAIGLESKRLKKKGEKRSTVYTA